MRSLKCPALKPSATRNCLPCKPRLQAKRCVVARAEMKALVLDYGGTQGNRGRIGHMYVSVQMHKCVCMCACAYVCMYLRVRAKHLWHTHTHTHLQMSAISNLPCSSFTNAARTCMAAGILVEPGEQHRQAYNEAFEAFQVMQGESCTSARHL